MDENEEDKDEGEVCAEFARSLSERFGEEGSSAGLSDSKSMLYAKTVTAKKRSLEANFVHFWNQLVVLLHGKETLYARGSAAAAGESADGTGGLFVLVCVELSKSRSGRSGTRRASAGTRLDRSSTPTRFWTTAQPCSQGS